MHYKRKTFIKLLLLFLAFVLASFLAFGDTVQEIAPDHQVVFVLDISKTMDTQDIVSGTQLISRLDAAKYSIQTTIFSESSPSYGLIVLASGADYMIPPTFDTGTFLLYLSGVTTHLLPAGMPRFDLLHSMITGTTTTTYVVLSDFASVALDQKFLPSSTLLLGIGSAPYLHSSAATLHLSSLAVSRVDGFLLQNYIAPGFSLPMAQRIVLYVVLGILLILSIFL